MNKAMEMEKLKEAKIRIEKKEFSEAHMPRIYVAGMSLFQKIYCLKWAVPVLSVQLKVLQCTTAMAV